MIGLISRNTINKAIERAKAERKNLVVRRTTAARQYRVENRATGGNYIVNFFVRNNRKFGHCSCPAGLNNLACKHIAAAAALNIYLAEQGLLNRKSVSVL
ncbi:MAG TPA: SWIM zinc finger family protein [Pyrinomonadaceae bacterium]|jgi:uncharacterized Zn finger protein